MPRALAAMVQAVLKAESVGERGDLPALLLADERHRHPGRPARPVRPTRWT